MYTCRQHPSKEQMVIMGYKKAWEKEEKSVTVEISDLTKLVINWDSMGEGSLVINNSLKDIIREVIYAERLSVEISVGTAVNIR